MGGTKNVIVLVKFINVKTLKFIKIINHNLLTKIKIKDKIDYVFHSIYLL